VSPTRGRGKSELKRGFEWRRIGQERGSALGHFNSNNGAIDAEVSMLTRIYSGGCAGLSNLKRQVWASLTNSGEKSGLKVAFGRGKQAVRVS